jgi:hypothetical protein
MTPKIKTSIDHNPSNLIWLSESSNSSSCNSSEPENHRANHHDVDNHMDIDNS